MEREISEKIVEWNNGRKRKPLILMGARQVGKTWLMKSFATAAYPKKTVFVNLMKEDGLRDALESSDLDPKSVVEIIELKKNVKIVPGETLLVLDEIQESPRALTALKFFNEDMPELAVMAAGSLLGLSLRKGREREDKRIRGSFPVGKVEFLDVRPMSFWEFLRATSNTADGGICINGKNAVVANCLVFSNACFSSGGIYRGANGGKVCNTIVFGNTLQNTPATGGSRVRVRRSTSGFTRATAA